MVVSALHKERSWSSCSRGSKTNPNLQPVNKQSRISPNEILRSSLINIVYHLLVTTNDGERKGAKSFFFQKISYCCNKIIRVLAAQGKLVLQQLPSNFIQLEVSIHATCSNMNRCKTGLKVGCKTRNIAFKLVFHQSCTFSLPVLSYLSQRFPASWTFRLSSL